MPIYALGLEYDGSDYHGWQNQIGLATIQGKLETALSTIADSPIAVFCAGRTDRGVHAMGQVAHFHTEVVRSTEAWLHGGNRYLPQDIGIQWVQQVDNDFHARHSALSRRYQYVIYNRRVRSALHATRMTWHYRELDAEAMHLAAQFLLGEHDFQSFRASGCQSKSSTRTIYQLDVERQGDRVIISIHANAFLQHMVRNITGVLLRVGMGEQPPDAAQTVLLARDRRLGDVTAPPYGLYLTGVSYPEHYQFPEPEGIMSP